MSVIRSNENLSIIPPLVPPNQTPAPPPVPTVCETCKNCITIKAHALKSNCHHYFHKSCFAKYTQNKTNCPTCNCHITLPKVTASKTQTKSNFTVTTRNQAKQQQLDENRFAGESQPRPTTPNTPRSHSSPESAENQPHYIRNLVTAAVGAQQAEMLSSQLTQLIQSNIEAGFRRMSINNNTTSIPLIEQNNIQN
ncbi:uncharacterized protein LOC135950680 [Calliphora vicina]|uniref:uncharacterized protein LOC135950680 n=1 Tax=Calliphora vicina TaxID=7373 RepID=UPI00325AB17F